MSGGVDSSVVAGILRSSGHDVVGVTLQLYDHGTAVGRAGSCCAGEDIHDARHVAAQLDIPHYVIDREAAFSRSVIGAFADSYARGETPVPCALCNQQVKFPELVGLARALGAERLATGHYVRRSEGPAGPELHRSYDERRDQSWFLFGLDVAELAFGLFPLGEMPGKDAVRAAAARLEISVADKRDSQDICFVPSGGYADLVTRLRPDAALGGEIVSSDGRVLGHHPGVAHYTVGQGKRLGDAAVDGEERQVVTAIDAGRRRLVVGPRSSASGRIVLREMNWLMASPSSPLRCEVKLRARDGLRPATVFAGPPAEVILDSPALAAPGQACVLYLGTRVLGGGFISRDL